MRGAISVDTDSLDFIYRAFKNREITEEVTYKKILPRMLDYFKSRGIRVTFFIIGSHIKEKYHVDVLKRMVKEGHELANHTYNHTFNFSRLSFEEKKFEISKCEEVVFKATGVKMVGFRAPGWDVDADTIRILEARGYKYDSSVFPSYFSYLAKLYVRIKNGIPMHSSSMGKFSYTFASLKPYKVNLSEIHKKGSGRLLEFPVNATPFLRIPFFGSFLFSTGMLWLFDFCYWFIRGVVPLNYELHSVELYNSSEDIVDPKIAGLNHPCIRMPYAKKLKFYNHIFDKFQKNYTLIPIKELLRV